MKFRWDKKYLYWGVTAFCVIAASILLYLSITRLPAVRDFFGTVAGILAPVLYGVVIAYLLAPLVNWTEKRFLHALAQKVFPKNGRRAAVLSRGIAVALALVLFLGLIALLLTLILPQLAESVQTLFSSLPDYISASTQWVGDLFADNPIWKERITSLLDNLLNVASSWAESDLLNTLSNLLTNLSSSIISLVTVIFDILVGLVAAAYLLFSKEHFIAQSKKITYTLLPLRSANALVGGMSYTYRMFSRTILGKLLDSFIVGVVCLVLLLIFRIPYAGLVSVIVGVTNVIPFFGPFIGAVPSAFLILLVDPVKCLIFIILIILLQQMDGNILTPKILGSTVGMESFWIMFATLFVGGLFGVIGMLIGVPLFAVLFTAIRAFSKKKLTHKGLPLQSEDYKDLIRIEEDGTPVYRTAPAAEEPQAKAKDGE